MSHVRPWKSPREAAIKSGRCNLLGPCGIKRIAGESVSQNDELGIHVASPLLSSSAGWKGSNFTHRQHSDGQSSGYLTMKRKLLRQKVFLLWLLVTAGASCPAVDRRPAPEFAITGGLADYQVLQRGAGDRADVTVSGRTNIEGAATIQARVMRRDAALEGFSWRQVGSVDGPTWRARLTGLPVGGPFTVEIRVKDRGGETLASARVCEVLVGDLWILAGQSNMEGVGLLKNVESPHELVHVFDMAFRWDVAEEPLHTSAESLDEAHWRFMGVDFPWWLKEGDVPSGPLQGAQRAAFRKLREYGAGLGLAFAMAMVERTGIPVGLIPCAHGGASIGPPFSGFPGWDPSLKQQGGASLYGAMLTRLHAAGDRARGVLWWQGENDITGERPAMYEARFRQLVASIRSDFKEPDLPFYYVQIGRCIADAPGDWRPGWKTIQQVQAEVEKSLPHSGMVPSVDLEMQDGIHLRTSALKTVGKRLANLACHDLFPDAATCRDLKRGPRPLRAHVEILPGPLNAGRTPRRALYVDFSGVNGRLLAPGRVSGFSVRHADGQEIPIVFHASIGSAGPNTVVLELGRHLPPDARLWYGWGTDPYCNLTDEAGMGVPAFGPLALRESTAEVPFGNNAGRRSSHKGG